MRKLSCVALLALTFALTAHVGLDGGSSAAELPVLHQPVPIEMLRSTVRVRVQWMENIEDEDGTSTMIRRTASGSGVWIENNKVLTAFHVVDEMPAGAVITVEAYGKFGSAWLDASVDKTQPDIDLATLKVDGEAPAIASIDFMCRQRAGAPLWLIGGPMGLKAQYATFGYLSSYGDDDRIKEPALWGSSNSAFFGNSGGPVFDANTGKLMGILVQGRGAMGIGMAPNVAIFVPLSAARGFLD